MHPDDRERVMFQWTRSIQTGNAYEIEHRIRRADGVYRWFQVRGRPLRDTEGRIVRWYNLVTDIDERKKTDEKLRRSEESLLEAQRLSHTGSWQHDVVSGMVTISPEIHQTFGSSLDEDTSNAEFWFNRIHPEDRWTVQQVFEGRESQKTDYQADYRIVLPDGTIKHLHVIGQSSERTRPARPLTVPDASFAATLWHCPSVQSRV